MNRRPDAAGARLGRFARLSAREKLLTLQAFAVLLWARVALAALPLQRAMALGAGEPGATASGVSAEQCAAAVRRAAPLVPGAVCLAQALALRVLLKRAGHACELRVGVRKCEKELEAHAWIEVAGHVFFGEHAEQSTFSPVRPSENSERSA